MDDMVFLIDVVTCFDTYISWSWVTSPTEPSWLRTCTLFVTALFVNHSIVTAFSWFSESVSTIICNLALITAVIVLEVSIVTFLLKFNDFVTTNTSLFFNSANTWTSIIRFCVAIITFLTFCKLIISTLLELTCILTTIKIILISIVTFLISSLHPISTFLTSTIRYISKISFKTCFAFIPCSCWCSFTFLTELI